MSPPAFPRESDPSIFTRVYHWTTPERGTLSVKTSVSKGRAIAGGKARMNSLSPDQRKQFASKGARARWSNRRKEKKITPQELAAKYYALADAFTTLAADTLLAHKLTTKRKKKRKKATFGGSGDGI
jgi:hypothetical protein